MLSVFRYFIPMLIFGIFMAVSGNCNNKGHQQGYTNSFYGIYPDNYYDTSIPNNKYYDSGIGAGVQNR